MFIYNKNLIYKIDVPLSKKKIKIASFDLDYTIIKTKSGNVFPKNKDDWTFYNEDVIPMLKEFHKKNYLIVIFTNQSSLGKNETKKKDFIYKINNILKKIDLPISVFISISYGYFRKPCTGAFKIYLDNLNSKSIDFKKSFYCGDAAGRPKGWSKNKLKKDFSSSDLFFANNIGLNFFLPEQIFENMKDCKINLPIRKFLNCKSKN